MTSTWSNLVGRRPERSMLQLGPEVRIDGRVALVTGGDRGLGAAIATELARHGAHVLVACRSRGPQILEQIRRAAGDRAGTIESVHLDPASFASVERLAEELDEDGVIVDITVLAREIAPRASRQTPDGIDEILQVNVLSNYLLMRRLIERNVIAQTPIELDDAPSPPRPRLVVVSSELHKRVRVDLSQLPYRAWGLRESLSRYCHSKLLLELWISELRKRLTTESNPHSLVVHSVSPAVINPELASAAPDWLRNALDALADQLVADADEAARPFAYLAGTPELERMPGAYWDGRRSRPRSPEAKNHRLGAELWALAETLTAGRR